MNQRDIKEIVSRSRLEVDRDHVHLLLSSQPHHSPTQIVIRLKMEGKRRIWREHPELNQEFWKKKAFWSDGYFCTTIGSLQSRPSRSILTIRTKALISTNSSHRHSYGLISGFSWQSSINWRFLVPAFFI
ncbi:MAG: IS200/IS605 family transposase [Promethearchaeota archaeon]